MPFAVIRRARPSVVATAGFTACVAVVSFVLAPSDGRTIASTAPASTVVTTSTTSTVPPTTAPPTTAPPEEVPPSTDPPPPPTAVNRTVAARVVPPTTAAPEPAAPPAPAPPPPAAATASPSQAARSLALLNSWRQQNGLPALVVASDAQAKAQQHAQEMAAAGKLWHTNLQSGVDPSWTTWAENVGAAGSADQVHQMFMASSSHNANMLSPNMTHVGVGAAVGADGNVYICQEFVG